MPDSGQFHVISLCLTIGVVKQWRNIMKYIIKSGLLISLLLSQPLVSANEAIQEQDQTKASVGFGLGAIIGGLIAGPPGFVIGAASGGLFGGHEDKHDQEIETLENELNIKTIELAFQQNELAKTRASFENEFKRVMLDREIRELQKLSQGISYVIYFKTNDASINQDVMPRISQLADLIKPYPQIKIRIEGFADARGDAASNEALSQNRINSVKKVFVKSGITNKRIQTQAFGEQHAKASQRDIEEYIYDRRVTINLTLDKEV